MPVQTRSMTSKAFQEELEQSNGKWAKYWERFEVYEHLSYGDLPIDVSWRDDVALFYNPETQIWSPKKKSLWFGSNRNILTWVTENPNFYREYALYRKDTRSYDLTNMFQVENKKGLYDLTKEELIQYLTFSSLCQLYSEALEANAKPKTITYIPKLSKEILTEMGYESEVVVPPKPISPFMMEDEEFSLKTIRKWRRMTKKELVNLVWSEDVEPFLRHPFNIEGPLRDFALSQFKDDSDYSNYYDAVFNFSDWMDRQLFIQTRTHKPNLVLDVEKYEVEYTMTTVQVPLESSHNVDVHNQTYYLIDKGSSFHATMVHLWNSDIRLVPILTTKNTIQSNEKNYFFRKVDTTDYSVELEKHNLDGEINTKLADWVTYAVYDEQYKINYEDGGDYLHAELVRLFERGIYVEPDKTIAPELYFNIMNYHGRDEKDSKSSESYRYVSSRII